MRRSRAIAGRNVVIQLLIVSRDKESRGGRGAVDRNRIPASLPLPVTIGPEIGRHLLVHETRWGQSNRFAEPLHTQVTTHRVGDGFRHRNLTVTESEVGAQLTWESERHGIPPRTIVDADGNTVPRQHCIEVVEGQWARLKWNARFTSVDTGNWFYESVVANGGVVPTADVPADLFTASDPAFECSELAMLR